VTQETEENPLVRHLSALCGGDKSTQPDDIRKARLLAAQIDGEEMN
jgi:putative component of toxin-antitoxin plasmid stabilization module